MSVRELVVLGTASQVPTRTRNHNGYLLRWDGEGVLFDPGEGTQRQMVHAGVAATDISRICVTHFHGDHCLGLPGVIQRLSLDGVAHEVPVHFPGGGPEYFRRLRNASSFYDRARVRECPVHHDGVLATGSFGTLSARRLDHSIDAYGYLLAAPDGRRMVPERLAEHGISGVAVGQIQRTGQLVRDGHTVTLDQVSVPRRGQRFAFVMDTRLCEAVYALAESADMLVIESTYLDADADLADGHGHLTAGQAARVAAEVGVRVLVLTHLSQRYPDPSLFAAEAAAHFPGEIVVARDLDRIPLPPR
ncbi:MAG TPA: ribonuclease Z [Micromonosporaceae bacterium]